MTVSQYAASCARYYADVADVGYSQPDRWTFYDRSDWDGWLINPPANADCSALVAGCYNLAAHHEWGEPFTAGYFPRSTWTGSLREECLQRNFADISDSWTGNEPDGGFEIGDIVLKEDPSGESGHVAMVTALNPTILSEAWIAEDGSTDGYMGDQTNKEVRSVLYDEHMYTQSASWTHCLRRRDNHGSSAPSHAESSSGTSIQQAVLRAADATGCPWWAALGCLKVETGEEGANIYGHDAGGACSGWGEVTEHNFKNYFWPIVSEWGTSNGVGPLQVTYNGYFINDPDRAWWDPQKSAEVGCSILKGLIDAEGDSYEDLRRVGSRYNSGTMYGSYEAYGVPFSDACRYWYNKGRPSQGTSDGGEELEVSYATDLLSEIKDRLVEVSDQTGAGIAGRRFDGPIVGWLKDISYKQDLILKALNEAKPKSDEGK